MRRGGDGIVGHDFALLVGDDDLRVQIFLVLDDDHGLLAGRFIHFLLHRHAFDDVVEFHSTGLFRKNRHVVRVPLHERLALPDLASIANRHHGADDDVVCFEFAAILGQNGDRSVLVQHDVVSVLQFDQAQIVVTNSPVVLGLDLRLLEHLRRSSADVERPHRQLRARLADGLRGDYPDRFAELHEAAGRQIAAVAGDADAVLALAGEHGADAQLFDARFFDFPRLDLVDLVAGFDELLLRISRVHNVVTGKPANQTFAEFDYFVFAFVNRLHPNTVGRAAVLLANDDVLRHVHQFARHVAGVSGLEGGVGQTFARPVR